MKIASIERKIQKDGVLIGKPYLEVRVEEGGQTQDEMIEKVNAYDLTFLEFSGEQGLKNETMIPFVEELKKQGKFLTVSTLGSHSAIVFWDYVTLSPLITKPDHNVIDGYLKLKTKVQVRFILNSEKDLKDIEQFLHRHYLIKKRRIPVILICKDDKLLLNCLDWPIMKQYNHRIMA